jgi:hypothetical protein
MKGREGRGGSYKEKKLGDARGEDQVQERCRAILETIAPGRVKYWISGDDYHIELPRGGGALWVYLRLWEHGRIAICIYPGNTMSQAQTFFKRVVKPEFLDLVRKGWKIQPSLALNFMQHFLQTQGNKLSVEKYFDFWAAEEISQIRRDNDGFEELSQFLRAHRVIDAKDQHTIKKEFVGTKMPVMNVCAGFELVFAWRRAEANRLDRGQDFVEEVRARTNEALRTWGQTL